ncbi:MAG: MCE family protein [Flavobacteriales bacterium]|nr:MCE family protein [Flavobacteriales bacterium]
MKRVSREFKIGVIVLLSVALLFVGVNYLKGVNIFQDQRNYFAVYENIDGLGESNPVVLNGFKIGLISNVGLHPNGSGNLVVEFVINDPNLKIPNDTRAKIFTSDLFGSKAVELEMGESMIYAERGDTLASNIEQDLAQAIQAELAPLKQKVDELTAGIETIVTNLQAVFSDEATQGLPQVFESLQRTMQNLEATSRSIDAAVTENRSKISATMSNVESITGNLRKNNESLTGAITNFEAISDSLSQVNLKQTILRADKAISDLAEITTKINNGEGSAAMLINSDSLHTALMSSNQELQTLLNDIYTNPWRYIHVSIFGKKDKKNFSKAELKELDKMIDEALEEEEPGN